MEAQRAANYTVSRRVLLDMGTVSQLDLGAFKTTRPLSRGLAVKGSGSRTLKDTTGSHFRLNHKTPNHRLPLALFKFPSSLKLFK